IELIKIYQQLIFRIGRNRSINFYLLASIQQHKIINIDFTLIKADRYLLLNFPNFLADNNLRRQDAEYRRAVSAEAYQTVQIQLVGSIHIREFNIQIKTVVTQDISNVDIFNIDA